jgi:hypothetical protein
MEVWSPLHRRHRIHLEGDPLGLFTPPPPRGEGRPTLLAPSLSPSISPAAASQRRSLTLTIMQPAPKENQPMASHAGQEVVADAQGAAGEIHASRHMSRVKVLPRAWAQASSPWHVGWHRINCIGCGGPGLGNAFFFFACPTPQQS